MSLHFTFGSLLDAIESLFRVAASEPAVVAQAADSIVTAATPAIDQIGGQGTAAKVTAQVDHTAKQVQDFLAPHLAQGVEVAAVAQGVTALLAANAAQAVASGAVSPIQPAQAAPAT